MPMSCLIYEWKLTCVSSINEYSLEKQCKIEREIKRIKKVETCTCQQRWCHDVGYQQWQCNECWCKPGMHDCCFCLNSTYIEWIECLVLICKQYRLRLRSPPLIPVVYVNMRIDFDWNIRCVIWHSVLSSTQPNLTSIRSYLTRKPMLYRSPSPLSTLSLTIISDWRTIQCHMPLFAPYDW